MKIPFWNKQKLKGSFVIVKTKRVELADKYEGAWIDIWVNPPLEDLLSAIEKLEGAYAKGTKKAKITNVLPPMYDILALTIQGWNLVDPKQQDLTITKESMKVLPIDLLAQLVSKVQEAIVGLPLVSNAK